MNEKFYPRERVAEWCRLDRDQETIAIIQSLMEQKNESELEARLGTRKSTVISRTCLLLSIYYPNVRLATCICVRPRLRSFSWTQDTSSFRRVAMYAFANPDLRSQGLLLALQD